MGTMYVCISLKLWVSETRFCGFTTCFFFNVKHVKPMELDILFIQNMITVLGTIILSKQLLFSLSLHYRVF